MRHLDVPQDKPGSFRGIPQARRGAWVRADAKIGVSGGGMIGSHVPVKLRSVFSHPRQPPGVIHHDQGARRVVRGVGLRELAGQRIKLLAKTHVPLDGLAPAGHHAAKFRGPAVGLHPPARPQRGQRLPRPTPGIARDRSNKARIIQGDRRQGVRSPKRPGIVQLAAPQLIEESLVGNTFGADTRQHIPADAHKLSLRV